MTGNKILPQYINVDIHPSLLPQDAALFIKNLVYSLDDTSNASAEKGAKTGTYKTMQSTVLYVENLVLPAGVNTVFSARSCKETKMAYAFVHNSLGNHTIYQLNGANATYAIVYQGATLNFQLKPEYFIHEGGFTITLITVTDPDTGTKKERTFMQFTDGYNPQRFICVEDAIATNGFNKNLFPYFIGDYDPMILINMGVPTPMDCIDIQEVPLPIEELSLNNGLLFNTWQFRLRGYDVWGRPTEYGIISDLYIPGVNDCVSSGSGLPRCINLTFNAPPPHINQYEIAYRNCNDPQWYVSDTLDLYNGSPLGQWWLRQRNPDVKYNQITRKITYQFCAHKDCRPIDPADTNRLYNPLPRTSQAVANVGKFTSLSNNEDGFLPFSKNLRDNIKITVEPPSQQTGNQNQFRNISVWMEIYNPNLQSNQPIWKYDSTDPFKNYVFGAFNTSIQSKSSASYKQYFPNLTQKGFVGYLAGTNYYVISKQYFLSNTGVLTEITDFSTTALKVFYATVASPLPPHSPHHSPTPLPPTIYSPKSTGTFLQKFEFTNVPKGNYIFRIASHQTNPIIDSKYQETSTYFKGLYAFNSLNFISPINHISPISNAKEITINACNSNYDGFKDNKIPVIFDLNYLASDVNQVYVKNTNVPGESEYGVELLKVIGGRPEYGVQETDYNGYFFTSTNYGSFNNDIYGYCACKLIKLFPTISAGTQSDDAHDPIYKYLNESSLCTDYEGQLCNQILIKGKVTLCNSSIGVPGVSVVLTRGHAVTTDSQGNFTIIAADDVLSPNRVDSLYFIPGSCAFDDCNGDCVQPIQVTINKCTGTCVERSITVSETFLLFKSVRGLLSGATYPAGVTGWDWLDRPTFIQPLGNFTMPSVQETKIFAPGKVKVDILSNAVFPIETTKITFWIGDAADISDYITWIVDKVEFVDNTGLVNEAAPTQIKIYYQSLIEYNAQNNYNTTVNWQFIPTGENMPVTSDKVEFLLNGDGTFFSKSIIALIKYDTTGQSFLINYSSDLANLKENAIIRLVRPKQCITTSPYWEICSTVNIKNRKAEIASFYLNAFDTYYINRQIPVPIGTTDAPVNQIRILGVPFESRSPSDFWGEGCHNIGRESIVNPNETVLYNKQQVALSGAVSETGLLNFINFFDNKRKTNFDQVDINGIVALLPETGNILVIGQNDNFLVGFSDNIVRINSSGQAVAPSIENEFGQPQNKPGFNYGCMLRDKNTISKRQGIVKYLDTTESVLIEHDYRFANPISKNGADSYIRTKIKEVQNYNLTHDNKRYFHGVINPINSDYLLTDFIIGSNSYVNHLRDFTVSEQETVAFGLSQKAMKASFSFTPTAYGFMEGDVNDSQLLSFKNGLPYRHSNALNNVTYGTVYGEPVNRIIRMVLSKDNVKKKNLLSLAVYCKDSRYFADQVITEVGQLSMIPLSYFLKAEYAWFAPFLCDLKTLLDPNRPLETGDNKLTDGDVLYGTYVDVRFVGDPAKDQMFNEIQGFVINAIGNEPTGVVQK